MVINRANLIQQIFVEVGYKLSYTSLPYPTYNPKETEGPIQNMKDHQALWW